MPSEPLVAAVETAEQADLESSAGAESSVDSRADERIATEGGGVCLDLPSCFMILSKEEKSCNCISMIYAS